MLPIIRVAAAAVAVVARIAVMRAAAVVVLGLCRTPEFLQ
jgi:hypothetical protein